MTISYNEFMRVYRQYSMMSDTQRRINGREAYEKLEQLLQNKIGHAPGYFTTTRVACAFIAADGELTMAEYELFKYIASSSCNYDELYDTVAGVSKNFRGALNEVTTRGDEIRYAAGCLAAAIFALKNNFGSNEETVFKLIAGA